ncbi:hypothetical protein ACYX7E_09885 [Luteimonas sp. RIT-PG2_3]
MPRQFVNPAPVLHDLLGTEPAFNGSLAFYDLGTTTPRTTWSDWAKTVPNENPVPLDPSGRTDTQIWLDGEYTVVLRNQANEVVFTRELRPDEASTNAIPPLETGKFLTNDATNLLWQSILQLPDPTGSTGRYLSTDGANFLWVEPPVIPPIPEPNVVVTDNSVRIGLNTGDRWLIQKGQGTSPATGTIHSSLAVVFPTAFKAGSVPHVSLTPMPGYQVDGPAVAYLAAPPTATGFTATFDVAEGDVGNSNITVPIVFGWIAQGIVAA